MDCPVKSECLILGLYVDEQHGYRNGIWGGLTYMEREEMFGPITKEQVA